MKFEANKRFGVEGSSTGFRFATISRVKGKVEESGVGVEVRIGVTVEGSGL